MRVAGGVGLASRGGGGSEGGGCSTSRCGPVSHSCIARRVLLDWIGLELRLRSCFVETKKFWVTSLLQREGEKCR
jgi:hypothetical protein